MSSKMPEIHAVLLVGGKGERFWPMSTPERPKQFLRIFSAKSMVAETVERISPLIPKNNIHFVLPPNLVKSLRNEITGVKERNLIVEPEGRNTAPAIGLAVRELREKPEAIMLVLPSDHIISPAKTYLSDLKSAIKLAGKGYLVTFGIPPSRPETGYGYIEIDRYHSLGSNGFKVLRFREKPDLLTARRFVKSGNFLWNSGMFAWKIGTICEAFRLHHPEIYEHLISQGARKPTAKSYAFLEAISVDYAVMEKARNVAAVPARFSWDDVGSWTAVERHIRRGLDKNTSIGKLISVDSEGCIAVSDEGEVALLGVSDLVVVRTKNAVLVCAKDRAAEVKKILERKARLKP